jgi:hypothetical protein
MRRQTLREENNMRNLRKLNRTIVILTLVLSLGASPALSVHAQDAAQKPAAGKAKSDAGQPKKGEKPELDGSGLVLLSDAEMEKVEGGNPVAIAIGVVGLAVGAYSLYSSRRSHQQLLKACTAPRR